MTGIPLLKELVLLMGVSVLVSVALSKARLPTIIGFLITGVLIGPHGLGLVTETNEVKTLAEIGIVLLLFTIGLEFSIKKMISIRREAILGGGLQLVFTIALVWLFSTIMGQPFHIALLLGFIVSLSSSAIVLKLLIDRVEVNSSHGSLSVGILLFQDISVVLMVLLVQGFFEPAGGSALLVAKGLLIAAVAIVLIVISASYVIPKLFHEVVKLRNREVFILTIVLVCLGTAWLASLAGLSLALGAFVAGLIISESEYSNQIVAEVLPFRDTFSSLFFVSMGMLLELKYFSTNVPELLLIAFAILVVKTLIIIGVGQMLRYPLRLSIIVGLSLSQVGEFSFILMNMGSDYGMLGHDLYQNVLAASILTMIATPFVFQWAPEAAARVMHLLGTRLHHARNIPTTHLSNHVIIVGYGLNGQNLAKVLKETAIEHLILDMNAERVKQAKRLGHKAHFGDSTLPEVMKKMGVEKAKMLVVGISDPISTRRIVKTAKDLNPGLAVLVRTRYANEVEELAALGATQVITEEFETSVEIFARVLKEYKIPGNIIQNQIDLVRMEGYAMFRNPSLSIDRLASLASILETSVMDAYFVEKGCAVEGMALDELDLRRKTGGATILAVVRKGKAHTNPRGDFRLEQGDLLVILGSHGELAKAMEVLKERCPKTKEKPEE